MSKLNALTEWGQRPSYQMLAGAKHRAKKYGLPFDLEEADIVIPTHCPVLGIPLQHKTGAQGPLPGSPTLDRIKPERGYVRGNVAVISNKANRIKQNATAAELAAVARWVESTELLL